ncbi:MAG: helix-turn-helix domain-containing protein [Candidatus Pacebacteria bacterium]|nr:helix-turn-helix domain-containing protein [Candidatus Paceibacterota bacterium]PIR63315.1 MAG: hypothetical protein COU64_05020 [Candidatus Pacebacteria bacterium CG10_big_fil_rev_8_21_14_0_10_40_26]PIZ79039.1 MAG: hypothetical protein COY01_01270 [Candidatus Pacebacteria bacterium CG_4_10_14_0_2_um_filter_40_20]PJA68515.1 MAG: hypothetical protein CO156_04750 [Candidatus Pacebacteria bacterium CG_4_9_14_3_um_filter_40_12]PJC41899.1 MAG: hypothetical protein CO041_02000 [Candidatus Pacebact
MYSLPNFLKAFRKATNSSQAEFANFLNVSTVLISMIESQQKQASKKFIENLAKKIDVHPGALALFYYNDEDRERLTKLEKELVNIGTELQRKIILKRAKSIKINEKK